MSDADDMSHLTSSLQKKDMIMMAMKVEMIFPTWKWPENAKCCREFTAQQEEF